MTDQDTPPQWALDEAVDPDETALRRIMEAGGLSIVGSASWKLALAQYKKEIGR